MKKVVSLILVLVMVFAMAVPAFAAQSVVIEDYVSPQYGFAANDFLYKIDAEKIIDKYSTNTIMYGHIDTYECNGPVTLTVEYDKKDIKKIMKSLDAKCNEVSKQVDRLNVNLAVEITPKYTLDMDLEDCLELFTK